MSETWMILGGWMAAGLTLCLFSFLYKDNPFFKIAEHLFLGASIGWFFQVNLFDVWIPQVWTPITQGHFLVIIPTLLGLSLVTQFFPKVSWISRFGFTFMMGYGAGMAIPVELSTNFMAQIGGTVEPIFRLGGSMDSFSAWMEAFNVFFIFFGLICVLFYFFFSVEHKGVVKKASTVGMYFLMLYFGAVFGNTVMGRFSLLFGRFDDLHIYSDAKYFYASQIIAAVLVIYFIFEHFQSKKKKAETGE